MPMAQVVHLLVQRVRAHRDQLEILPPFVGINFPREVNRRSHRNFMGQSLSIQRCRAAARELLDVFALRLFRRLNVISLILEDGSIDLVIRIVKKGLHIQINLLRKQVAETHGKALLLAESRCDF
jgi:hypothetical protein